jgi:hypothetical protein
LRQFPCPLGCHPRWLTLVIPIPINSNSRRHLPPATSATDNKPFCVNTSQVSDEIKNPPACVGDDCPCVGNDCPCVGENCPCVGENCEGENNAFAPSLVMLAAAALSIILF